MNGQLVHGLITTQRVFLRSSQMPKGLSSNWKALQARIDSGDLEVKEKSRVRTKRARHDSISNINGEGVIRKRSKSDRLAQGGVSLNKVMAGSSSHGQNSLNLQGPLKPLNFLLNEDATLSVDKPIQIAEFTERQKKPGRYIAIDAEFVGIGDGRRSGLARVSIVNYYGYTLLDTYVRPKERVRDWRTWVSGIRPSHMRNAVTLEEAQAKVADLIKNRIVVGHAIRNDFSALKLSHPHSSVRDTSSLPAFRALSNGQSPGLKRLSREILKIDIQTGQHSSVEDAQATMLLFRLYKHEFEVLTLGKKARAPLPNDI